MITLTEFIIIIFNPVVNIVLAGAVIFFWIYAFFKEPTLCLGKYDYLLIVVPIVGIFIFESFILYRNFICGNIYMRNAACQADLPLLIAVSRLVRMSSLFVWLLVGHSGIKRQRKVKALLERITNDSGATDPPS